MYVVAKSLGAQVPVKLVLLHRGESNVMFSTIEVLIMAEPFKLSLVDKFSFG